ncbi:TIGR03016 family PEP-CTERM system-associated outer membrane protein [Aquincola tertiaricarbonis]|uniref:TIGR03016 family PEP-CTERM system-associated outer membrane protein n=1 Tax=Aquincola tertiaricarbonis TaxID=391953 RepID=UPI0018DE1202|nr:TIGR03016 family PEP-CTERM system-associated outer membrane protein [Aquincola tertiaricarbonis]
MTVGLPLRPALGVVALAITTLACGPAARAQEAAQQGEGGRAWRFTPSLSVQQTFTDNYRIQPDRESDAVTQATVGMRLVGAGTRLRGDLDLSLTGLAYARHSEENNIQRYLRGNGSVELLEDRAFVEVNGSVTQQQISAFGPATDNPALANDNRTQVTNLTISPFIRGPLGGSVQYEARYTYGLTRSSQFGAADSSTSGLLLSLQGGDRQRTLSWSLAANSQVSDFSEGEESESDSLRGTLSYPVLPSVVLTGIGGVERSDLQSATKERHSISGLQLEWVPSERTNLSARFERRYFGDSHAVNFSFRTPRTVWTFSDTRDINLLGGGTGNTGLGSVYDVLFLQFASVEPDLQRRDLLVRSLITQLNLNPNATVIPGFLSASPTLQRRQSLSLALVGKRSNLLLQASQSNTQRVNNVASGISDDLSRADNVRQRGFDVTFSHKLTPIASVSTSVSWQRSRGDINAQSSALKTVSTGYNTQIGYRTSLNVGARYTQSTGSVQPYTERAVYGSVGFSF